MKTPKRIPALIQIFLYTILLVSLSYAGELKAQPLRKSENRSSFTQPFEDPQVAMFVQRTNYGNMRNLYYATANVDNHIIKEHLLTGGCQDYGAVLEIDKNTKTAYGIYWNEGSLPCATKSIEYFIVPGGDLTRIKKGVVPTSLIAPPNYNLYADIALIKNNGVLAPVVAVISPGEQVYPVVEVWFLDPQQGWQMKTVSIPAPVEISKVQVEPTLDLATGGPSSKVRVVHSIFYPSTEKSDFETFVYDPKIKQFSEIPHQLYGSIYYINNRGRAWELNKHFFTYQAGVYFHTIVGPAYLGNVFYPQSPIYSYNSQTVAEVHTCASDWAMAFCPTTEQLGYSVVFKGYFSTTSSNTISIPLGNSLEFEFVTDIKMPRDLIGPTFQEHYIALGFGMLNSKVLHYPNLINEPQNTSVLYIPNSGIVKSMDAF